MERTEAGKGEIGVGTSISRGHHDYGQKKRKKGKSQTAEVGAVQRICATLEQRSPGKKLPSWWVLQLDLRSASVATKNGD